MYTNFEPKEYEAWNEVEEQWINEDQEKSILMEQGNTWEATERTTGKGTAMTYYEQEQQQWGKSSQKFHHLSLVR